MTAASEHFQEALISIRGLASHATQHHLLYSEWQHQATATAQKKFKTRLFVESQRSQESVICSPASLLPLLPQQTPLGLRALGLGLTHSPCSEAASGRNQRPSESRQEARQGAQRLTPPLGEKQSMKLNQRQTHRKPRSPAVDSRSTGELDHGELVSKGDSKKDTQNAERK